jgi:hypothetical protein
MTMEWFIATKTGRTVALAIALTVGFVAAWAGFKSHYYQQGWDAREAKYAADKAAANVRQAAKNEKANKDASAVANKASDDAAKVNKGAEETVAHGKEAISNVYKQPPKTAPVAPGACVRPVDPRVQSAIGASRRAANDAGGSL